MRHAQQGREHHADQSALFVRVNGIVTPGEDAAKHAQRQHPVERHLRKRRPDLHAAHERGPQAAEDAQPGHHHVGTERIRHEIDLMAEGRERADAMKFAERCAARLEERLRRDHQNAQDGVIFS